MFLDRAVGIDLGTTNSEIALLDPSEQDIVLLADRFGRRTVPSAVAWDPKTAQFVVGARARARRGLAPGPIESIKRKMGSAARIEVGPHTLSPEQVSAKILEELVTRMREYLASKAPEGVEARVERAVITVPAYFDAPQIDATRRAGELAGLDVLGILQEPTAAAMFHAWKGTAKDASTFLVYDLGGGTFDVSVVRAIGSEYQVLAIDGDNYLGGDDFDRRFAEVLRKQLCERGYALQLDPARDADDATRLQRLVHLAQEVKEALSTSEVVSVSKADFLVDRDGENVSVELEIGRADYERSIADLVDRTIACALRATTRSAEVAQVGLADIDCVILVGGSTRVPAVVRAVTEALSSKTRLGGGPLQHDVDTVVALGAALHAAQLGGTRIGDDAPGRELTLRATTPLVTRTDSLKLGLVVERAPAAARYIEARDASGGVLVEAPLGASGASLRLDVPVESEPTTTITLALTDHDGGVCASVPLSLHRGEVRPRASALSQPAVVAKDLAIEVAKGTRRERRVLIPRGTSLPFEGTFELATGDASGAVVLRILQNRLPIKTLMLQVPADLPVGTPVTLRLRADESMRLEANASVGGLELWSRLDTPESAGALGVEYVDALLARVEQVDRAVWGTDARFFRNEALPLATGLRELVGIDPEKLAWCAAQLESLLEQFGGSTEHELSPPFSRLEASIDATRRIVFSRGDTALLGLSTDAWRAKLDAVVERGRVAFDANDRAGWRAIQDEAQALYETVVNAAFASSDPDAPERLARLHAAYVHRVFSLRTKLDAYVLSAAPEVAALQSARRDALVADLDALEARPIDTSAPSSSRRDLERRLDVLDRVAGQLERLASLGLVTDRR